MSIYVGNTKINPLGISKVYVGSTKVYEAVSYDPVFANNTWAQIKQACQSGNIPSTWAVGDYKTITISNVDYKVILADKTEGRYVYASDNSYTHASFVIDYEYSQVNNTALTSLYQSCFDNQTGTPYTMAQNFMNNIIVNTDLNGLIDPIKIKAGNNTSFTSASDITVSVFWLAYCELSTPSSTSKYLVESVSYKTGENLPCYGYFSNDSSRIYSPAGTALKYWTRSNNSGRYVRVNTNGGLGSNINTSTNDYCYQRFAFSW